MRRLSIVAVLNIAFALFVYAFGAAKGPEEDKKDADTTFYEALGQKGDDKGNAPVIVPLDQSKDGVVDPVKSTRPRPKKKIPPAKKKGEVSTQDLPGPVSDGFIAVLLLLWRVAMTVLPIVARFLHI